MPGDRMEWVGIVRRGAWENAGFGSLHKIKKYIEHTEPRYDPTVFPLEEDAAGSGPSKDLEGDDVKHDGALQEPPSPVHSVHKKYSVAYYRSLYLSGELTPLDVVQAILPLIRRDTSPPGEHSTAWFDIKVDLVIKAAEASTLRYKEKRSLGPLDGIPTAVKDEYDMGGYVTTLGSKKDYTGPVPKGDKVDTWCVRMLEGAGAIILGKLSMHEFGLGKLFTSNSPLVNNLLTRVDTSGSNITYGTPRNPYNQQYYTGGSSSGAAYAVSAGIVPITSEENQTL